MAVGQIAPLLRLARAADGDPDPAAGTDRYYIFCYFSGGWDVLLSLDPRDPGVFGAGQADQSHIIAGWDQLANGPEEPLLNLGWGTVGAYLGDLATQHADKLAIVRGLNMETLSHQSGQQRFLTGKPPSGTQARGSSAATWLASVYGKDQIIPNLVSKVGSYNADQPPYASGIRVASVSDLLRAVRPSDPKLDVLVDHQIEELLAQAAACPRGQASEFHQSAELSRLKSIEMVAGGVDTAFDFLAKTDAMAALRDHYGFAANSSGLATAQARAAMAARAITQGVSRCVSVAVAGGLDTHYDNWASDQGPRQMAGFNAIARMVEDLAATEYQGTGTSWLDHTNIVAFSEFSRTSMLNPRGGRDHWLGNSCLLLGADIAGGQVIGGSSDVGMQPQPIDLQTGQVDPNGEPIRPEHIIRSLFEAAGITGDPADLRADPIWKLLA